MKPKAWSFSSLDDFINCPRAYYEKRIAKSVQESQSPEMIEGNRVHKAFENRQADGLVLPDDLEVHEEYMKSLENQPGKAFTERKVAFDMQRRPTTFFARDCWSRLIIDYTKIHDREATIVDYKTGKPHSKFKQLSLAALHVYTEFPNVHWINVEFYWTKTRSTTAESYTRDMVPEMWSQFAPDLRQYVEAFREDVWQPRPSGLCNGWCPVTDCEHWKPKRPRR